MRELKFRAFAVASKKMFWPDTDDGWEFVNGKVLPLPNTILMQFTGLRDKNGKEIYEGDIVKIADEFFPIEYGECHATADDNFCGGGALGFHAGGEILGNGAVWDERQTTGENIEVVGNVHQNPELLK